MLELKRRIKTAVSNILLIIISIIITLVVAEIALRLTPYKEIKRPDDFFRMKSKNYYIEDSEAGFDIAKNFKNGIHHTHEFKYDMFSNKYGCFDYDREVPDNYILAIGDSFTWGYAPLEKKWTTYLEEKSHDFILKCGLASYGTRQELIKAKRVVKQIGKSPKYLLLMYYENDMRDDFVFLTKKKIYEINTSNGEIVEFSQKDSEENKEEINSNGSNEKEEVAPEIKRENENFIGVMKSNNPKKRKFWYKSVLYNIYVVKVKPLIRAFKEEVKRQNRYGNNMSGSWEEFANFRMTNYLHQKDQLKWYSDIIDYHKQSLNNVIQYAKDINTTLLIVDIHGTLEHEVFKDISANDMLYYYNLKSDCPKPKKWNYDMHWNIEGNQEVGECIYQHFKKIGIFK